MSTNHPLRAWRTSKALSLEQAARLIGVNPSSLTRYELGQRRPTAHIMARIEAITLRQVMASDFLPPISSDPAAPLDPPGVRPERAAAFSSRPGAPPAGAGGSFTCDEEE